MQLKGAYWWLFVYVSTASVMISIIEAMKVSIHLYLTDIPEIECAFIALGLYCVSLYGALSLTVCNDKSLKPWVKVAMATIGISLVVPMGILVCIPICAHAMVYIHIGTLNTNAYNFWIVNYSSYSPELVRWYTVTVLLFLASYIGFRLIFNQLKPYFLN